MHCLADTCIDMGLCKCMPQLHGLIDKTTVANACALHMHTYMPSPRGTGTCNGVGVGAMHAYCDARAQPSRCKCMPLAKGVVGARCGPHAQTATATHQLQVHAAGTRHRQQHPVATACRPLARNNNNDERLCCWGTLRMLLALYFACSGCWCKCMLLVQPSRCHRIFMHAAYAAAVPRRKRMPLATGVGAACFLQPASPPPAASAWHLHHNVPLHVHAACLSRAVVVGVGASACRLHGRIQTMLLLLVHAACTAAASRCKCMRAACARVYCCCKSMLLAHHSRCKCMPLAM